jgi:hypothetical protein
LGAVARSGIGLYRPIAMTKKTADFMFYKPFSMRSNEQRDVFQRYSNLSNSQKTEQTDTEDDLVSTLGGGLRLMRQ